MIITSSKSGPMPLVFIVKIERTVRGKLFDLEQALELTQVTRVDVMCLRLKPSLCCPRPAPEWGRSTPHSWPVCGRDGQRALTRFEGFEGLQPERHCLRMIPLPFQSLSLIVLSC